MDYEDKLLLKQMHETVSQLVTMVGHVLNEQAEMRRDMNDIRTDIKEIRGEMNDIRNDIKEIRGEMTLMNSRLDFIQQDVAVIKDTCQILMEKNQQHDQDLFILKRD